ncbi:MAG: pyruvoyl-dependent arginine decarboxylase [Nitrospinota bacterium]
MIIHTPSRYFLAAGAAEGFSELNAFDAALHAAGVGDINLVKLSSILPPGCRGVEPFALPPGAIVPTAYARIACEEPGQVIAAGVAIAFPEDSSRAGLIMEHSAWASRQEVEEVVRRMAYEGMKLRELAVREIKSLAVEHRVQHVGAAFAGVVLWE